MRRAATEIGLRAIVYSGELDAVDTAPRLGVAGLAGDLIADGAFGSRTAALCRAVRRPGPDLRPRLRRRRPGPRPRRGLHARRPPGGFRCIGDAALEAIDEGCAPPRRCSAPRRLVARPAPTRARRDAGARGTFATLARLGVVASVQPVFDALWGGPAGMYAARLGERWSGHEPLPPTSSRGGVRLAFGSDSPVTPLVPGPPSGPPYTTTPRPAAHPAGAGVRAHTRGGALRRPRRRRRRAAAGHRADLAVWDVPGGLAADGLPDLDTRHRPLPVLRRLLAAGTHHPRPRGDRP